LILSEESDDEHCTDNKWAEAEYSYEYVPPVNVFIQKAVEHLDEES
jgi:hypothetical protein